MKSSVPGGNRNCSSEKSCPSSWRYHDHSGGRRSPSRSHGMISGPASWSLANSPGSGPGGGRGQAHQSTHRWRKWSQPHLRQHVEKDGLDLTDMLVPSKSPFYGIVPGNASYPLSTVILPVTFGMRENYCTEFIKFEVANFESSYHAILGRPANEDMPSIHSSSNETPLDIAGPITRSRATQLQKEIHSQVNANLMFNNQSMLNEPMLLSSCFSVLRNDGVYEPAWDQDGFKPLDI
jgi:hypothetical protein